MDHELLTYRELAARKGWKSDSARRAVLRNAWEKVASSDGGPIKIKVPAEALRNEIEQKATAPVAIEADGLRSVLESERRRADSAEADRDAWRSQAIAASATIEKLLERI